MLSAQILDRLGDEALLLEPREHFDDALVSVTDTPDDHWPRKTSTVVAVYDRDRCIDAIMAWLGCDYETAVEWYDYNTTGAWLGEGTPTFSSGV